MNYTQSPLKKIEFVFSGKHYTSQSTFSKTQNQTHKNTDYQETNNKTQDLFRNKSHEGMSSSKVGRHSFLPSNIQFHPRFCKTIYNISRHQSIRT